MPFLYRTKEFNMMSVFTRLIKTAMLLIKILKNAKFVKKVLFLISMVFVKNFLLLNVKNIINLIICLLQCYQHFCICFHLEKVATNATMMKLPYKYLNVVLVAFIVPTYKTQIFCRVRST